MTQLRFTLNGSPTEVTPRAGESLLETLRNRCGILSTKDGCSPQGQCGCCLALVGGRAVVTCAMPAEKVAGKEVITLEGLAPEETELLAKSFVADASRRVIASGHQVHGAIGFTEEHALPLYSRRSSSAAVNYGDAAFHREIVAKEMGL